MSQLPADKKSQLEFGLKLHFSDITSGKQDIVSFSLGDMSGIIKRVAADINRNNPVTQLGQTESMSPAAAGQIENMTLLPFYIAVYEVDLRFGWDSPVIDNRIKNLCPDLPFTKI